MRTFQMAVLTVVAALAVGCISVDSVVKVKADGTGTIEQTMLINSSAVGMMSMMGGTEGGGAAKTKLDPAVIFSKEKLSAEAARLGDGVTLLSSTPVTQGEMNGVKAVYAFTDFNTLRVSTAMPDLDGGDTTVSSKGGETLAMVMSKAGGNSLITLDMFSKAAGTAASPPAGTRDNPMGQMPKEMMGMLAPMFKDMRVAVAVEPQGQLVRTNATHVEGQRITLLDVAFGEIFADPAGFEKLEQLGQNPSLDQIRTALKGMKGIKINEVEKLEIEFR